MLDFPHVINVRDASAQNFLLRQHIHQTWNFRPRIEYGNEAVSVPYLVRGANHSGDYSRFQIRLSDVRRNLDRRALLAADLVALALVVTVATLQSFLAITGICVACKLYGVVVWFQNRSLPQGSPKIAPQKIRMTKGSGR